MSRSAPKPRALHTPTQDSTASPVHLSPAAAAALARTTPDQIIAREMQTLGAQAVAPPVAAAIAIPTEPPTWMARILDGHVPPVGNCACAEVGAPCRNQNIADLVELLLSCVAIDESSGRLTLPPWLARGTVPVLRAAYLQGHTTFCSLRDWLDGGGVALDLAPGASFRGLGSHIVATPRPDAPHTLWILCDVPAAVPLTTHIDTVRRAWILERDARGDHNIARPAEEDDNGASWITFGFFAVGSQWRVDTTLPTDARFRAPVDMGNHDDSARLARGAPRIPLDALMDTTPAIVPAYPCTRLPMVEWRPVSRAVPFAGALGGIDAEAAPLEPPRVMHCAFFTVTAHRGDHNDDEDDDRSAARGSSSSSSSSRQQPRIEYPLLDRARACRHNSDIFVQLAAAEFEIRDEVSGFSVSLFRNLRPDAATQFLRMYEPDRSMPPPQALLRAARHGDVLVTMSAAASGTPVDLVPANLSSYVLMHALDIYPETAKCRLAFLCAAYKPVMGYDFLTPEFTHASPYVRERRVRNLVPLFDQLARPLSNLPGGIIPVPIFYMVALTSDETCTRTPPFTVTRLGARNDMPRRPADATIVAISHFALVMECANALPARHLDNLMASNDEDHAARFMAALFYVPPFLAPLREAMDRSVEDLTVRTPPSSSSSSSSSSSEPLDRDGSALHATFALLALSAVCQDIMGIIMCSEDVRARRGERHDGIRSLIVNFASDIARVVAWTGVYLRRWLGDDTIDVHPITCAYEAVRYLRSSAHRDPHIPIAPSAEGHDFMFAITCAPPSPAFVQGVEALEQSSAARVSSSSSSSSSVGPASAATSGAHNGRRDMDDDEEYEDDWAARARKAIEDSQ